VPANAVRSADPLSLKDVSTKLEGRHLLSDGRPVLAARKFNSGGRLFLEVLLT
jgi:hypothetical protein